MCIIIYHDFIFLGNCQQIQSNMAYKSQTSSIDPRGNIFFAPKLSLEGRNILPQLVQCLPYSFHKDQPFLTILKKPLMSLSQKTTQRKQRKPVCVVGKAKQFEYRQLHTGIIKKRVQALQSSYSFGNGVQLMSHMLSMPKYLTQEPKKSLKKVQGVYYFYMGIGNNCELVEKVLRRRKNWLPTTNTLFNLRWEQIRPKYTIQASHRQIYNHLPNHQAISNKGSLLKNMKIFCQKIDQPIYDILPVCFQLNFQTLQNCQNQLKKFLQFYWEDKNKHSLELSTKIDDKKKDYQKKSITKADELMDEDISDGKVEERRQVIKLTKNFRTSKKQFFNINSQENIRKKQQIRAYHKIIANKLKPLFSFQDMSTPKKQHRAITPVPCEIYGDTNLWLLKPTDLNRGRGIKLFRQIQQLSDILLEEVQKNQKSNFIIQKYIEKPLLIENRKFDIRVWAMVSHNKDIYFFKEGYIRTSCQQFQLHSKNQYTHLTNNAIQKNSKKYGTFEDGNQISLDFLFKEHINKESFMQQMKNYIKISFSSVSNILFTSQSINNISTLSNFSPCSQNLKVFQGRIKYFQIFGYDFMVDINKHLWLIEVNTNPCLQQSSKLLKQLIPRMVDDALKLTIDKIFNKSRVSKQQKPFSVKGYSDEQNMWQQIELIELPKTNSDN